MNGKDSIKMRYRYSELVSRLWGAIVAVASPTQNIIFSISMNLIIIILMFAVLCTMYNVDNVHSFLDFIIVLLRHYEVNLNSWIGFDLFLMILSVFKKYIWYSDNKVCIGLNRIFRDRILGSDKSLLLHIIIIRIEWDRRM
jgi:hypothetical protein